MRNARYIDISVPLGPGTTLYPGDPPTRLAWPGGSHAAGDGANVGSLDACLHAATHADAPWHFIPTGWRIDEVPLDRWLGPCTVLDLTHVERFIDAAALDAAPIPPDCQRLLLKTRNGQGENDYWLHPFRPDFTYLHPSAACWLTAHHVHTLGFDYLTIDPPADPTFPAHRELLARGCVILECLNLRHVPAGEYELLAAPIRVQGADAAWCRAVLRCEMEG